MGVARVQHIFNPLNNLPEDQVVNTWYFVKGTRLDGVPITGAEALSLAGIVHLFYNTSSPPGNTNLALYMGHAQLTTNRETIKVYDLSDPEPRSPLYTVTPAPPSANNGTTTLPSEVSCCLSFRGQLLSGTNAARRRGRVYIGPLNTTAGAQASGISRPATAFRTAILDNAVALQDSAAAIGFTWCVISRTQTDEAGCTPVFEVLCDDAWDTQRRRGPKATGRLTRLV